MPHCNGTRCTKTTRDDGERRTCLCDCDTCTAKERESNDDDVPARSDDDERPLREPNAPPRPAAAPWAGIAIAGLVVFGAYRGCGALNESWNKSVEHVRQERAEFESGGWKVGDKVRLYHPNRPEDPVFAARNTDDFAAWQKGIKAQDKLVLQELYPSFQRIDAATNAVVESVDHERIGVKIDAAGGASETLYVFANTVHERAKR